MHITLGKIILDLENHEFNFRFSGGQTGEWALVQEEQMGPPQGRN